MKFAVIALGAYYAGVVAPIAWSPFIFLGLLVFLVAVLWANAIEDDRSVRRADLPVARSRRRS